MGIVLPTMGTAPTKPAFRSTKCIDPPRPRQHPVLGEITPSVEAVAKALARRDRVRLQPFGGYAANLLRLSEQVPAQAVFLTDGKPRKVHFGRQIIELRRASPRMMAAAEKGPMTAPARSVMT